MERINSSATWWLTKMFNVEAMPSNDWKCICACLQENGHLASKLQLTTSLETKYRAALADLEGAEGLAALSSPRTAALPSHAPTFTFPCTPDEASASAAATATC